MTKQRAYGNNDKHIAEGNHQNHRVPLDRELYYCY
jgi:hypothetical protein